jgi:Fe-S-cluster containining protein
MDPKELREWQEKAIIEYKKWIRQFRDSASRTEETLQFLKSDAMIVPDMVEYIGSYAFTVGGDLVPWDQHYYTCKHFNKETGDCMNYEYRPHMCSGFPYWGIYEKEHLCSCPYPECEMKVKFIEKEDPESVLIKSLLKKEVSL